MKSPCRFLFPGVIALAVVSCNPLFGQVKTLGSFEKKAVIVSLTDYDLSTSLRFREFSRLVEKAEKDGASALIFNLNVRQSVAGETQQRLIEVLAGIKLPSIAYVNPSATGAGALVALGCESIYLSPAGVIGGAGIDVVSTGEDNEALKREVAQQLSVLKARARSLARQRGHRIDVAEAFVDSDTELRIGDRVVSKKGAILTLTADEAMEPADGKPLLGKGLADSVEEVVKMEEIESKTLTLTPQEFGSLESRERVTRAPSEEKADEKKADTKDGGEEEILFGRRDSANLEGRIVILEVGQDTLATGKASFDFMDRILKKAELDGAVAVIFDIDTPGGYAWYTQGLVLDSLQNVSIPTYSFVNTKAESAGAIVAVGTDHIYMRPAATIGSALVVSGTGQDLAESMNDKVTQMIIATVRNIAELKGHNPDIAEAFVTRDKEVRIDGVVVHEAGNVLNLNTIDATEVIGGRPVLAKGVARDLEDLIAQEKLAGEIYKAEPLGMESFAHLVQKFSFLLIIIGLAGAYMEMNSPGFGLPGLTSVLAFGLFFFGNYLAGNLAGYELAVLFILGLVLIGVEIFLFPGAIIPGMVGGVLVISALGFAMVDRVDFEWKWSGLPSDLSWWGLFRSSLWAVIFGFGGALVLAFVMMRYLPESRFGRWLVLEGAVPGGASLETAPASGAISEEPQSKSYVGWEGTASTDLRPAGKGEFQGNYLDIISDGEFIEKGASIVIQKHEGSRVVVRRV